MTGSEFRDALYALHEEYQSKQLDALSPDWWWVADRLPTDKLISELKYLSSTRLMSHDGNSWHQLCAILHDYKKYKWTKKQRNWCICQLATYWDAICLRRGM